MMPPGELKPNAWNTNVVSPDNEAKLEESIKRFSMFKPVVVRELKDGTLEIIGGEHRAAVAARMGIKQIPVVNLGKIDDKKAKEISLVDNGRYGNDDTLKLAELLDGLGNADELVNFMPFTEGEIDSIFSSVNIALDELDTIEGLDDDTPIVPKEKPVQTHQIMRFKVPVEDAAAIADLIDKVIRIHKFTESDSLTNAGDALVHVVKVAKEHL